MPWWKINLVWPISMTNCKRVNTFFHPNYQMQSMNHMTTTAQKYLACNMFLSVNSHNEIAKWLNTFLKIHLSRKHKAKAPPAVCANCMRCIMMSVYWFYLCVSVYLPPLLRVLWSGPLQQTEALGCPQILQRRVTLSPLSHTTSLRGTMNSGGTAASNSETFSHFGCFIMTHELI